MVKSCSALNCFEKWEKDIKKKFHRIPQKDINLREQWLQALRRKNYNPKDAFICEKHFRADDYELNVHGNKVLKKGTIPSLFNFSRQRKNVKQTRRRLKSKNALVTAEQLPSDQAGVQLEASRSDGDTEMQIDKIEIKDETASLLNEPIEDLISFTLKSEESSIKFESLEELPSTEQTRLLLGLNKSDDSNTMQIDQIKIKAEISLLNKSIQEDFSFPSKGGKPCIKLEIIEKLPSDHQVQVELEANRDLDITDKEIDEMRIKHEVGALLNQTNNEECSYASKSNKPYIKFESIEKLQLEANSDNAETQIDNIEIKDGTSSLLNESLEESIPSALNSGECYIKSEIIEQFSSDQGQVQLDVKGSDRVTEMQIGNIEIRDESAVLLSDSTEDLRSTSTNGKHEIIPFKRQRRDPIYFGDFEEADLQCQVKLSRFWKVAQQTVLKQKKQIKYYQCKVRRQSAKIKTLKRLSGRIKETKQNDKKTDVSGITDSGSGLLLIV